MGNMKIKNVIKNINKRIIIGCRLWEKCNFCDLIIFAEDMLFTMGKKPKLFELVLLTSEFLGFKHGFCMSRGQND